MNFNSIPAEIKLKIFSYFTPEEIRKSLARVCTEWWEVCKHPSLWKRLQIDIRSKKSVHVYRQLLASYQNSLTSLTLRIINPIYDFKEYFCYYKLDNLKELVIDGWCLLTDEDTFVISSSAPNVEILSIYVSSGITGLRNISSLKNLKSLTLAGHFDRRISGPDLEHIVKVCTKLEAFLLKVFGRLDDAFLVQLAKYRKETLKHLIITRDYETYDGIRALTSCENLSTLCFKAYCLPVTDVILSAVSTMQKLVWLDLGGNVATEPQTWNNFFRSSNLSSLKILQMAGTDMNDNGLVSIATTCKKLVILDLSRNYNLHDAGVQAVIDNCSELFFLDISCSQVTSEILPCVPTKLPQLEYLNLQSCRGIDEIAMERFTLMCPGVQIIKNFERTYVEYTVDKSLNLKCQFLTYLEV